MAIHEEVEVIVKFVTEYESRTVTVSRTDDYTISMTAKTDSGSGVSALELSDDDVDTLVATLSMYRAGRDKEILQAPNPNTDSHSAFK